MSSSREGVLLRGTGAERATPYRERSAVQQPEQTTERRSTIRRAADLPVVGGGASFRLGDVYAEELARLREHAHAEGFTAGHAEGMTAAADVVAETERAAAERLADVQARWERRVASATAALGAAVTRLDEASLPLADEVRETVLGTVLTLVEDLVGRELALAEDPVLDAVRRALALVPVRRAGRRPRAPRRPRGDPRRGARGAPRQRPGGRRPGHRTGRGGRRDRLPPDRRAARRRARAGPGGAQLVSLPSNVLARARAAARPQVTGSVTGAMGLTLTVDGISAAVGDLVEINPGERPLLAEVVAVGRDRLTCMPLGTLAGVHAGAPVRATGMPLQVPVGEALLGRVLDGLGRPVDGGPSLGSRVSFVDLASETPHALSRARVDQPLTFGVRALDTLVPCGKGQRLGIFAGSGVGKSSLLAQITRGTDADVRVIGLIGERGREVREFLEENLGAEGMARTVVVVATSDEPPLVRLKAAFVATRIAEAFRDEGRDVLLLMDSITRTAMAQREVGPVRGRAAGHARLPAERLRDDAAAPGEGRHGRDRLHHRPLHRAGRGRRPQRADRRHRALDPRRAHRADPEAGDVGHFPSIDVLESISRVASAVVPPQQMADAREVRRLMGALRDVKELIEIGAYQTGSDPLVDRARQLAPAIEAFLQQPMGESTPPEESWGWLQRIVRGA